MFDSLEALVRYYEYYHYTRRPAGGQLPQVDVFPWWRGFQPDGRPKLVRLTPTADPCPSPW